MGKGIGSVKFVRAWMSHETTEQVAIALDMKVTAVRSRAYYMRKQGVRLPKKNRHASHTDIVNDLNDIINSYTEAKPAKNGLLRRAIS